MKLCHLFTILIGIIFSFTYSFAKSDEKQDQKASESLTHPVPKQKIAVPITLKVKTGKIEGEIDLPEGKGPFPIVIIIAGSGPTDRNGNSSLTQNDCLKQLGQGLAANGIAALRFDRRGVGKSAAVQPSEENFRFEMLVADVMDWTKLLGKDSRFSKIVIAGHSEGSLVGILAAQKSKIDALISLEGPGRRLDEGLREQLKGQLSETLDKQFNSILDQLVAGQEVSVIPITFQNLIRPSVQKYLISSYKYDPTQEIAKLKTPVLIIQGTTDLQVKPVDGKLLAKAKKDAELCEIENMNHVLKQTTEKTIVGQLDTYTKPEIPIDPKAIEEIAKFIEKLNKKNLKTK